MFDYDEHWSTKRSETWSTVIHMWFHMWFPMGPWTKDISGICQEEARQEILRGCDGTASPPQPTERSQGDGLMLWRTPNLDRNGMFHPKNDIKMRVLNLEWFRPLAMFVRRSFLLRLHSQHLQTKEGDPKQIPHEAPVLCPWRTTTTTMTWRCCRRLESSVKILEWLMAT
jgi:hypothetical protein